MSPRHLLDIDDLTTGELNRILDLAEAAELHPVLERRSVGLYFEKQSLRTRHSCESAVAELGGHPVSFDNAEVGIGTREPVTDVARVLSGFHALLGARVHDHEGVLEPMAAASSAPVVNLLSDRAHPLQTLADLLTMRQHLGELAGTTVAWVGDFNNVARSLALGCGLTSMTFRAATPPGFAPTEADLDRLRLAGCEPRLTHRPAEAVEGADAVHTDVFTSMGQEAQAAERSRAFEGFTVDDALMAAAGEGAVFMHCLPAHRDEEVAASVVDGDASLVWSQANNRKHSFRGLLLWLAEVGAL